MRNDGLDGAKRKSVQEASALEPGDFMGGMTLRASKRSAGWRLCPASSVTVKGKPGTEPYAASWSNPDMCAPQACNSPGSGGCGRSSTDELRTGWVTRRKPAWENSILQIQGRSRKAPLASGCVPTGRDRHSEVCRSRTFRNIAKYEKLVSWDWFWPLWKNSKNWL